MTRPTQVVINLSALRHNFSRVQQLAPHSKIIAIVKADAYGHGLTRVAQTLTAADAFGVASVEEAMELRLAGITKPVLLLEGPYAGDELKEIEQLELDIVVHSFWQIQLLESAGIQRPLKVWLKVDSGMHRLGFAPAEVESAYSRLTRCAAVDSDIRLMTHLADASDPSSPMTTLQLNVFNQACSGIKGQRSIANSAGIVAWSDTQADYIRPGLLLYGVSPVENRLAADYGLVAAMTLRSKITSIKAVHKGETVGYGAEWSCPEDMLVGIVAAGYGDGYPRHGKSGTPIIVHGQRTQVIGNPSMDMLTVDLRGIEGVQIGSDVELWGNALPVEEVARHAQTISYELLCAVHKRVKVVVDEQAKNPLSV
jgi:alanine racemase